MPKYRKRDAKYARKRRHYNKPRFANRIRRAPKKSSRAILGSGAKMSYMTARCPQLHEISVASGMFAQNAIRLMLPWQQIPPAGQIQGATMLSGGFKETERFVQCKPNWKQYAVKGMKIDWIPKATLPANNQIAAESLTYNVGIQDPNLAFTKPSLNLLMEAGNVPLTPCARFRKWLPMKALSKTQHLNWQETSVDVADATTLSDAWSMLVWQLSGDIPQNSQLNLGICKVTWYITFRGQIST